MTESIEQHPLQDNHKLARQDLPEANSVVRWTAEEAQSFLRSLDQPFVPNAALAKALKMAESIEVNERLP